MANLSEQFHKTCKSAAPLRAAEHSKIFVDLLKVEFAKNPKLFEFYTTHDIAETMRNMQHIAPDADTCKILAALYKKYDPKSNHEFRAADMTGRLNLMKALSDIPEFNIPEDPSTIPHSKNDVILLKDRVMLLKRLHHLHADIGSFPADNVITVHNPARTPTTIGKSGEKINDYIISHGSHCKIKKQISLNTYFHSNVGIPSKIYQSLAVVSALMLHEGRHTYQDYLGHQNEFQSQEFRDVADIMRINASGDFYLWKGWSNAVYVSNPTEKDAYDFQRDMENFLKAPAEERKSLIMQMEMRRNHHLSLTKQAVTNYPQPALSLAA